MSEQEIKRQKPETLRLRQVMPSLTVGDIEASIRWYTDILGCVVRERHEREGRYVAGTEIDYVMGATGAGFKFNNPKAVGTCGCGSSFAV